jgi:hypothetical protein
LSSPDFKVDGSQLTVSWAEPKGSTSSSSSDSSSAAQVNNVAWKTELSCLSYFFDVYIMYPYSLQLADLLKHVYNFVLIVILATLLVKKHRIALLCRNLLERNTRSCNGNKEECFIW